MPPITSFWRTEWLSNIHQKNIHLTDHKCDSHWEKRVTKIFSEQKGWPKSTVRSSSNWLSPSKNWEVTLFKTCKLVCGLQNLSQNGFLNCSEKFSSCSGTVTILPLPGLLYYFTGYLLSLPPTNKNSLCRSFINVLLGQFLVRFLLNICF